MILSASIFSLLKVAYMTNYLLSMVVGNYFCFPVKMSFFYGIVMHIRLFTVSQIDLQANASIKELTIISMERQHIMGISLEKNQRISLQKNDGGQLTKVRMGLGWDQVKKRGFFGGGEVDLDASALLFDRNGGLVDTVAYNHLRSNDGSVQHGGDNLTGAGDGDDETIYVDLSRVPANVEHLVFVITAYTGQAFSSVENVFCRLVDDSTGRGTEVVRYNLGDEKGSQNAQVMAKVSRSGSGWDFTAIGLSARGKVARDLVSAAQGIL